ncbi:MAG: NAD(P)H-hydrate epimerase [Cenarchaeum symbiont of Oopsacas minuta]|nr:NAD(P)H-hydrate epimerase [Cenarchaeum symbiont of Oopsacas minuta]
MEISVKQMMAIENNGHEMGFLKKFMMENAGAAAANRLIERTGDISSKKILVYAGLGNNGGDAMVVARHLAGYGANPHIVLLGDFEKIKTEESRWNWNILTKMHSVEISSKIESVNWDIIIDGILGTGITGDIREPYASAISSINRSDALKLAIDVPSGLDPDTGRESNVVVKADMTVTFHKLKSGMPSRADLCGTIHVEKIGIPPEAEKGVLS